MREDLLQCFDVLERGESLEAIEDARDKDTGDRPRVLLEEEVDAADGSVFDAPIWALEERGDRRKELERAPLLLAEVGVVGDAPKNERA
jgi:hypothetical protein